MSNNIILKTHSFINNLSAITTTEWVPVTFGYSGVQNRSIFGKRTDKDSQIHVFGKIQVPQFDSNGLRATAIEATATVTTFASGAGTNFNCTIETPLTHIRVVKVNASGSATIAGII